MNWSPKFLAALFKKQEISQQVVTRMQDLASEFSQIFGGDTPGPSQREGWPPSTPILAFGPGVGTQTLVPLNFSAVVAPLSAEHFTDQRSLYLTNTSPSSAVSDISAVPFHD